jgi:serralysin
VATISNTSTITVDGNLSDWTASELIDNPGDAVPGYSLYGTVQDDTYFIAIQATAGTDPVIGAGTTIWLNTDQSTATGYSPFDSIGAEYNVTYVNGAFYLYTGAAGQNLVSTTPLTAALSPDGESLEIAIPRSLVTPPSGPAPGSINIAAQIDTVSTTPVFLPGDFNSPEYTITDPATLAVQAPTHKVAIVYSDTSAALYFSQTAYSDLFMAAQNQARMAGVSYDIIDESQLTNINNLIGYDAIIFPSMADVNTAELPAIISTLTSAVYNYHIGIITAGDFLTNDQTGAPLPGNSYSNMETLLGLVRSTSGNNGAETVTANDVTNTIMKGYTAGQVIQTYASEGYAAYQGVGGTATDVLVNQNVTGVGTLPGVVQTTTGGTNVHFATTDLLGDSNLLSNAIQTVALGTQPGVALHMSRDAGVVAVRMDMDQSQFPADVSPAGGGSGIYGTLIPILQQWNQQYDFVGSYFINIGDTPTAADPATTNWAVSLPYYQDLLAMGSEIGNHSYTHLLNPPTTTVTETTTADTPAGSTQITLGALPSFAGVTVGMTVTGTGIATNTIISAVTGTAVTLSSGLTAAIAAGTTLIFGVPAENTNFLQSATTTNPVLSASGNPFTYAYEFQQSAALESQELGIPIEGAAVPGANETFATDQNILPYYQSVAATAATPGYTGFLTGGWTGVGSGYPSAIGYMSPSATDMGSLYIAPNMTFDFTEIEYEGKTVAQAEADWAAQFNALTTNAAGTPVVVLPVHDYGVAAWNTTTDTGTGSPYTTAMYTQFIAQAYAANYEFLTLEELAARDEAQQKAAINYTTVGNTITATVTPDPTAPDVGGMALDVVNGGTDVIQNVTGYYAYNAQELFLPTHGGTFTINLGTSQDTVTHIASLPMRGDLLSVTGDGLNLSFAMVGTGDVLVDLANTATPTVTGATIVSDVGNQLTLSLTNAGENDVSITLAALPTISGTVAGQATTDLVAIAPFSKVTIGDTNANQTETVTVTLSAAANGTLLNLGGGSYNATTGVYTDAGTAAAVTTALDGLVFTPTVNQVAPGQTVTTGFVISDKDTAGGTATDSTTTVVATDTAVPPTITGTLAGQRTTDRATVAPFANVTIADSNLGQTETVTVTLSAAANGTLSNLGGGSYNATTGVYTDAGTAAAVTAALDALVFTPTANKVAPGQTVTTTFTIADTDTALATATNSTTTVVTTALQSNRILLQNTSGQAAVWQVNGTAISSSSLVGGNPGPFWSLVGTGAFFAGDTGDYLWRGANGSVGLWQMSGTTIEGHSVIAGNPGTSWLIAGTGDFYGDGHTDILWQNDNGSVGLWDMNGATVSQLGVVAGNPGPTWHIRGTGDFYGDGHTDILWQNDSGSVGLWDMNGTTVTQLGVVAGNPGPTWHIMGTGDFYGDGHTDILWQNDSGSVGLWEMNGTTVSRLGVVAGNPGPTWHIVGTGDFNGDGKTDIVWRNDNGSVGVWDMNGTTILASGVLANPGVSWSPSGIDSMRFIYPTSNDAPLAATPAMPDEFVLTSLAPGSQTITGFDPMQDVIELSKAQFASFTQVQAATSAIAGGAMINLGHGNSLLLPGVNPASLHAGDFAFG